jgi:hypothetical protein
MPNFEPRKWRFPLFLWFFELSGREGACAITAYIGRDIVQARTGKRYDFRRFRGDLVHEEVVMPRGVAGSSPSPRGLPA